MHVSDQSIDQDDKGQVRHPQGTMYITVMYLVLVLCIVCTYFMICCMSGLILLLYNCMVGMVYGWHGYGWHGIVMVTVMFACLAQLYILSDHVYFTVQLVC